MKFSAAVFIGLVALASPLAAQGRTRADSNSDIPKSERPPAGMCRIWLDNVPPAQQPAPTDCATAVRNRPAKGRVVFGDDYVKAKGSDSSKGKPPIKGFAPNSSTKKPPLSLRFP